MFNTNQESFKALAQIVAQRSRPLVAWVGAGLSVPARLPTWVKLRDFLCDVLRQKAEEADASDKDAIFGKVEAAKIQTNLWIAFGILREGLGMSTYQYSIRDALREAERAAIPDAYKALWKLRLSGVLNLNIDRLASRAFTEVHGSKSMTEFSGRNAASHAHVLGNLAVPFIANLHGTHADATSWVFTNDELVSLMDADGYKEIIATCILSRAIVFVGVSAEDFAAGGHMTRMRERRIDALPHFWLTDRRDRETVQWAERSGVLLIHYSNPDGKHSELQECIEGLLQFLPEEPPALPVRPIAVSASVAVLPPSTELVGVADANQIRQTLNAEAARILGDDTQESYAKYEEFSIEYEEAIHRAWFVPRKPEGTQILGYQIVRKIKEGGFGTVYEVKDREDNRFALKLLHESIRSEPEHLQSFRRGVRSMRMLTSAAVGGIVRYHDACEIPAFVVMDLVPGPTLHSFVMQRTDLAWGMLMDIACRLAGIIRRSHQHPEGIMHRDIRPPNVMFKEEWHGADDWDVVVLDFDLSWHKGAQERSVTIEAYSGYLAPEQVIRDGRYSTRSSLVDAYGLGMTLFFLRTRREPAFMQSAQAQWRESLEVCVRENPCREWISLPRRYFRLIENSTFLEQSRRWDVSQLEAELLRLKSALENAEGVDSAELLAEELMARAFQGQYEWDSDKFAAVRRVVNEIQLVVSGDESARQVRMFVSWTQTGEFHLGKTSKWAQETGGKIAELLRRDGWVISEDRRGREGIVIVAAMDVQELAARIADCARTLSKVNSSLIRK